MTPLLLAILFTISQRAPHAPQAARTTAAALVEGTLASASIGGAVPYRVLLPPDYHSASRRYPVLYLLHGLTGSYHDWADRTRLVDYLPGTPLIVVMPDGDDSWYTNAVVGHGSYEDFLVKELVPEIDRRFRSVAAPYARAIAGLSMGGYGAIKFGLKYPRVFAFAGSSSGAFDVVRNGDITQRWPDRAAELERIFGPPDHLSRQNNDVFRLAARADPGSLPYFYVACGTDDPFLSVNRELVALLQAQHIRYEYHETPGTHAWDYWDRELRGLIGAVTRTVIGGARR